MKDLENVCKRTLTRLTAFLKAKCYPVTGWYRRNVRDMGCCCFKCETECGKTIRYVHTMINCITGHKLEVGCICATGLIALDDYATSEDECFETFKKEYKKSKQVEKGIERLRRKQKNLLTKVSDTEIYEKTKNNNSWYAKITENKQEYYIFVNRPDNNHRYMTICFSFKAIGNTNIYERSQNWQKITTEAANLIFHHAYSKELRQMELKKLN